MIHYKRGDIFTSRCDWLTNPVNCVGIMGAGLAKEFRRRYPQMFELYRFDCRQGCIQLGGFYGWVNPDLRGKNVALVPTKNDWRNDSALGDIERSLEDFARRRQSCNWVSTIRSIAFPKLGCGLGGLDWSDVKPVMERHLEEISNEIRIEIWE